MNLRRYSHLKFSVVLGIGAAVALMLCVQCVRTFLYIDAVLIPQQAEREAEREGGALSGAARSAGITDPRALGPVIRRALESSTDHVLWIRVLDLGNNVLAQGGSPQGRPAVPLQWWDRIEKHESVGTTVDTPAGKAFIAMLPFRMARPPRDRHAAFVIELAMPLRAVAGSFAGLRENVIVGLVAAIVLLVSLAMIALRTRHYLRGKYLESELRLARRVQRDLQPKPYSISSHLEFAAAAVAADHVGGDFYDVFEAEPGKIAIVLGDASGKGVPAALLVGVLQGAIRSSTASHHEFACERINRMLCERTACERFATLFWGVFDSATGVLRYVNAGHVPPILIRRGENKMEQLVEGGPVIGLLPGARYSFATVQIGPCDSLVLYSDGISEAADRNGKDFGEDRIREIVENCAGETAAQVCERIMHRVTAFASADVPADDRTLMVVRFLSSELAYTSIKETVVEDAVA